VPYMNNPGDLEFIPGAPQALAKAKKAGFKLILVTNQSGIGRGKISLTQLESIHEKLHLDLERQGAALDSYSFCPHVPSENCNCRKPEPGILIEASKEHDVDLSRSFMIGDRLSDVKAGQNAGCHGSILLLTGDGVKNRNLDELKSNPADYIADDLPDAVNWILETTSGM